tara:strand:- start:252 stop:839 length:588 start_codon:yes stop_codon:yes gene_type:complete
MKLVRLFLLFLQTFCAFELFGEQVRNTDKISTPILVLSQDDLFQKSNFGKSIIKLFEEKQSTLFAEAREIEEKFVLEERNLTSRRLSLVPEEFQLLADEFDKRVEETRKSRAEKDQMLQKTFFVWRKNFFQVILPIVRRIMRDYGAVAVLDTKSRGFVYDQRIDVTDLLIFQLNEEFRKNPDLINQIIVEKIIEK